MKVGEGFCAACDLAGMHVTGADEADFLLPHQQKAMRAGRTSRERLIAIKRRSEIVECSESRAM